MIHVGISGPIAAGKSTLAHMLHDLALNSGYAAEIISFATGIRELVALERHPYRKAALMQKLFAWGVDSEKAIYAAEQIANTMTEYPSQVGVKNRRLLQIIGTEIGRDYLDVDFWIYRTQQLARSQILDFSISDDLRFDNEALAVDIHIGIDINTDVQLYQQRITTLGADYVYTAHASEKSLTYQPLFVIPVGFTPPVVIDLFKKLEYIRRLRMKV